MRIKSARLKSAWPGSCLSVVALALSVSPAGLAGQLPDTGVWFNMVAAHSGKCVEVAGSGLANAANIRQAECRLGGRPNQLWKLEPIEVNQETQYQVIAQHSEKCFDVSTVSVQDGASIWQWQCIGAEPGNQVWSLEPVDREGQTWYQLIASHSEKCADVAGGSQADRANVIQYTCHGNDNQLFQFQEPAEFPNFRPNTPEDWSGPIIISTIPDTNLDSPRYAPGDQLFGDWSVINDGMAGVDDVICELRIDGERVSSFGGGLGPGGSGVVIDQALGRLSEGWHEVRLIVDPDDAILESDETDNEFARLILVGGPNLLQIPTFGSGGGGLGTDVVVTNLTSNAVTGSLLFFDGPGAALDPVTLLDGGPDFFLDPLATRTFSIGGGTPSPSGAETVTGSAVVSSTGEISAVARFTLPGFGIAGVSSAEPTRRAIVPVRRQGALDTGIAARTIGPPIQVELTYRSQDGTVVAESQRALAANARFSEFVTELFPDLVEGDFAGTVTLEADGPFSAVAIELEADGGFTTLPTRPLSENILLIDPIDPDLPEYIDILEISVSVDQDLVRFAFRTRGRLLPQGDARLTGVEYRFLVDLEEPFHENLGFPGPDVDLFFGVEVDENLNYVAFGLDIEDLVVEGDRASFSVRRTFFDEVPSLSVLFDSVDFQAEDGFPFDQVSPQILTLR